jgi:hypothetical protein
MGHRSIANTVAYTAVADKRIRNIWANEPPTAQARALWPADAGGPDRGKVPLTGGDCLVGNDTD